MAMKSCLIIPDVHIPYHDVRAWRLMINAAKSAPIDEIYILGDFCDFYSVSSYPKNPEIPSMLKDEVAACNEKLDELDLTFPDAKKYFIQGNHEWRLEKYLVEKAPALFGITSTEHILNLDKRPNWKFIPYGPNQSVKVAGSYLVARHEPLSSSAKATASKALCSLVYGHIHRIEESHLVGLDGTNHVCFSVGWLGDKRKDQIFDYVKSHHQWQLGFGHVLVNDKNRYFYHQKIHIMDNYTCTFNGKLFTV